MHIFIHINRYMNKYLLKKRSFMFRPVSPQKIPSGAISTTCVTRFRKTICQVSKSTGTDMFVFCIAV